MDTLSLLLHGFEVALQPMNLMWALIGSVLGTAIGILPGIGPALTIALLLPGLMRNNPARARRLVLVLASLALTVGGGVALFHAGVEQHWWQGFTACTSTVDLTGLSATDRLNAIMKAPVIRCDVAQWTLGGISLAGFNAIFSLGGAVAILLLMRKAR